MQNQQGIQNYQMAPNPQFVQSQQIMPNQQTFNQPEYQKLQDAYSLYLHTVGWYFSDYSKGVHYPSGFEKTSSEVIKNLRTATAAAQKTVK